MPLTADERRLRASIAGLTGWANTTDPEARSARGRTGYVGLLRKFEQQADPEGQLSPRERAASAERLYRAHMQRMRLRAQKAARERREERERQLRQGARQRNSA